MARLALIVHWRLTDVTFGCALGWMVTLATGLSLHVRNVRLDRPVCFSEHDAQTRLRRRAALSALTLYIRISCRMNAEAKHVVEFLLRHMNNDWVTFHTLPVVLSCSAREPDKETTSHLMSQDKRQKKEASSIEDELLGYRLMVSGGQE